LKSDKQQRFQVNQIKELITANVMGADKRKIYRWFPENIRVKGAACGSPEGFLWGIICYLRFQDCGMGALHAHWREHSKQKG
jgi:hypothetical protein